MNEEDFYYLLKQFLNDRITEEELEAFLTHLSTLDNSVISEKIDKVLAQDRDNGFPEKRLAFSKVRPVDIPRRKFGKRSLVYTLAASLALFVTISLFITHKAGEKRGELHAAGKNDIIMDDSAIVVRKSDGEISILDKKDSLYHLGSVQISLDNDGQINYAFNNIKGASNEEIEILIPKGKTSFVRLSDSTKVWLNSNSAIKFKPHFSDRNRIVSLSGEAYFEVQPDKLRPFIVTTHSHDVEVLGTAFNVSSYTGMTAKTTLLEGVVKIKHDAKASILKPSHQFSVNVDGLSSLTTIDAQETIAWRDGLFVFNRMHLKDIILHLSNWYPIENIKVERWTNDIFTGVFMPDRSLKSILNQLSETSSYEFKIKDGTLEISVSK